MDFPPLLPTDFGDGARGKINAALRALSALFDANETEQANRQSGDAAVQAFASLLAWAPRSKPGVNPGVYAVSGGDGAPDRMQPLDPSFIVSSALGPVYRVRGATSITQREPIFWEASRVYEVKYLVLRLANPSDPAGDTVRLAIRWLDAQFVDIGGSIVQDLVLTSAMGLQSVAARVPSGPGDAAPISAPPGTVWWRPVIQTYGLDGVTDLIEIAWRDITGYGTWSQDLSEVGARLTALETRVATLDPLAAGTVNGLATLDSNGWLLQLQPTLAQFMIALNRKFANGAEVFRAAIPSGEGADETTIAFEIGGLIWPGGLLANLAKSTFGMSDADLISLMAQAKTILV